MFKQNRLEKCNARVEQDKLSSQTPASLFEEITQIMALPNWNQWICEKLKSLSILTENEKGWYDLVELPSFSNTILTILRDGYRIFEKEPDENILSNTELVLNIISSITYNYHESSEVFVKNWREDNFYQYIEFILNNSFKMIVQMGENISDIDHKEEFVYFKNIIILWLTLISNMYYEFWSFEYIDEEVLNIEITAKFLSLIEWIHKHCKQNLMDSEFCEIFENITLFVETISNNEDDEITMNGASNLFEMFVKIYYWILPINLESPLIDWGDRFIRVIKSSLQSISNLIETKESIQIEFLGTEELLKLVVLILKESLKDIPKYQKVIEVGWGIIQTLSSQVEYDKKFKEVGLYDILFELLLNINQPKSLSCLIFSLQNLSIVNEEVKRTSRTKDSILFLWKLWK